MEPCWRKWLWALRVYSQASFSVHSLLPEYRYSVSTQPAFAVSMPPRQAMTVRQAKPFSCTLLLSGFCHSSRTWVEPVQGELWVWMCSYYTVHLGRSPFFQNPVWNGTQLRVSVPAAWGAGGGLPCWSFVADLVLGLYKPFLISVQTHSFPVASVLFIYVSQEVALIPYWLKCLSVWRTHRYNFSKIDCTFIF